MSQWACCGWLRTTGSSERLCAKQGLSFTERWQKARLWPMDTAGGLFCSMHQQPSVLSNKVMQFSCTRNKDGHYESPLMEGCISCDEKIGRSPTEPCDLWMWSLLPCPAYTWEMVAKWPGKREKETWDKLVLTMQSQEIISCHYIICYNPSQQSEVRHTYNEYTRRLMSEL